MAAEPYNIQYAPQAVEEVRSLRACDQQTILDSFESHLAHSPTQASRTRIKRMHQPFWSQYRPWVGDFRLYYDVDDVQRTASILRVLKKGQSETPKEPPHETDRTDSGPAS